MHYAYRFIRTATLLVCAGLMFGILDRATGAEPAMDEHAHHHAMMMQAPAVQTSRHDYQIPTVTLRDEQGNAAELRAVLDGRRDVVVNFIFSSCTTICPVMTATMLQLQKQLHGADAMPAFVSISIDPDFDTPRVLKAYAGRFGADWQFLTGPRDDILTVLRAFDAWRGNKNNHAAVTLMRKAGQSNWTRVDGLASAQELAAIWKDLAT